MEWLLYNNPSWLLYPANNRNASCRELNEIETDDRRGVVSRSFCSDLAYLHPVVNEEINEHLNTRRWNGHARLHEKTQKRDRCFLLIPRSKCSHMTGDAHSSATGQVLQRISLQKRTEVFHQIVVRLHVVLRTFTARFGFAGLQRAP